MPVPVFGVVAGNTATPYPSSSISITRGGSDNFAVGGGALFFNTGQTADYGPDAMTPFGAEVTSGLLTTRMFGRVAPASGAQNFTLAGPADRYAPAVMTFSGVDTTTPLRGHLARTSSSGTAISETLATLTADEITVAYVAWYNGGATGLTATGDTTVRAQGTDGAGLGWALLTSTTNVISFTRATSSDLAMTAAILTGSSAPDGPTITAQPAATTVVRNDPARAARAMAVAATTNGSGVSVQWYRGASGVTTTPVNAGGIYAISTTGTTSVSSTLTITPTDNSLSGQSFWCRVTDSAGSTDSAAAVLTVRTGVVLSKSSDTTGTGGVDTLTAVSDVAQAAGEVIVIRATDGALVERTTARFT
jgi:hypothetical protein